MMVSRIIFTLLTLCILVVYGGGKKKKTKLSNEISNIKIHTFRDTYELQATRNCHSGGWLPDPISVDCICVKGIWAVSTGYCDANTTIYIGNGHCFLINQKVRKFFNLDGDKGRPFKPSNYLITGQGEDFQVMKGPTHQLASRQDFTYLIRVNPKHPMFQKNFDNLNNIFSNSKCTPSVRREFQNGKNEYIYISQVSGKNHFSLGTPGFCDKANGILPYWTLSVGQSFRLHDQQITEGKMGKPDRCPASRILDKKKKDDEIYYFTSKRPTVGNTSLATRDIEEVKYDEYPYRSKVNSMPGDYDLSYDLRLPIEGSEDGQINLLQIQTRRLGGYYKSWILYNKPGPDVKHVKEYEYLQIARKLILKTCKSSVMTPIAINNLVRWFRWIWRESLDVYSYNPGTHPEQHKRILNGLNSCLAGAKEFKLNYKHGCGPAQVESVEAEGVTYSGYDIILNDTVNYEISHQEASMEFIYKLMSFVHHYCAESFGGYPTDHSTLNVIFESMFSPLMKLRWKNPDATMSLMRLLWPNVNIVSIFETLDTCVATARSMSAYSDYIMRPIDDEPPLDWPKKESHKSRSRPKRSLSEKRTLWNQLGFCIQDPKEVKGRYEFKDKCNSAL